MSEQVPLNIYQRLNEVRKAVSYIKKDKAIAGRYNAVTHDYVTAELRPHLIQHGIMIVPVLIEARVEDSKTSTSKGVPIIRYEATYDIRFVNCDQPDDIVYLKIQSHALDEGDKAPGKAISYAVKYAMLKLFSIETGEDDEGRITQKPTVTPRAGAMESLNEAAQEYIHNYADEVHMLLSQEEDGEAWDKLQMFDMDGVAKVALWDLFDSTERTRLTAQKKKVEKAIAKRKPGEPVRTVDDALSAIKAKDYDLALDVASGLGERDKRFIEAEVEAAQEANQ